MSNIIDFQERRLARLNRLAKTSAGSARPVILVMARIGSCDQHMFVELEVSSFLGSANDIGLVALLQAVNGSTAADLAIWASERNRSIHEILEYVESMRDTEFETDIEVRVDEAQLQAWIDQYRPELSRKLSAEAG